MWTSLALALVLSQAAPEGRVVEGKSAAAFKIAQGKGVARLYVNATNGSPDAAVSVLTLQKGAVVPEHSHETAAEILYIVEGSVEMTVAGKTVRAKAGDVVLIPKNVRHSATASSELRAVQVYGPAGPEQRFTTGERLKD